MALSQNKLQCVCILYVIKYMLFYYTGIVIAVKHTVVIRAAILQSANKAVFPLEGSFAVVLLLPRSVSLSKQLSQHTAAFMLHSQQLITTHLFWVNVHVYSRL